MRKKPRWRARLQCVDYVGEWWVIERRGWFGWGYEAGRYGRDRAIKCLKNLMDAKPGDGQVIYDYEVAS